VCTVGETVNDTTEILLLVRVYRGESAAIRGGLALVDLDPLCQGGRTARGHLHLARLWFFAFRCVVHAADIIGEVGLFVAPGRLTIWACAAGLR
jgi:hypothetical protein